MKKKQVAVDKTGREEWLCRIFHKWMTAAGFLVGSGGGTAGVFGFSPIASKSVRWAVWLVSSRLLDRLGMEG